MIQRHVYLRLAHTHSGANSVSEVAQRSRKLAEIPEVKRVQIGMPVDDVSCTAWELCLILDFDSMADIEAYIEHPLHRAYVDEYLKPRLQVIKAWNFEVGA